MSKGVIQKRYLILNFSTFSVRNKYIILILIKGCYYLLISKP